MENNKATAERVTFHKVMTGVFDAYLDGVKTDYQIVNGCAGLSGRDTRNIYLISRRGEIAMAKVRGPLRTCKMAVTHSLMKMAATARATDHELPQDRSPLEDRYAHHG